MMLFFIHLLHTSGQSFAAACRARELARIQQLFSVELETEPAEVKPSIDV
jgi:hypothetical protein